MGRLPSGRAWAPRACCSGRAPPGSPPVRSRASVRARPAAPGASRLLDLLALVGVRRGLDPAVRLDRVRERRGAADAPPLQLRRPAAALDLRQPHRERRGLLAREPDLHGGEAALPVRGRPPDGRARPVGREPALAPSRAGPRRLRASRPRAAPLGRTAGGGRLPVRRGTRRLPAPDDGWSRGLPGRGRVEEPLPGPLRPAAWLPAGPSRRPPPPVVVAPPPPAGRAGARSLGRGRRVGDDAARSPPHVPLRLARGRRLGARPRPREGGRFPRWPGRSCRRRGRPGR